MHEKKNNFDPLEHGCIILHVLLPATVSYNGNGTLF